MARIAVIGSGFSGLSAACFLAKEGFKVTVFEKNATAGGRARQFTAAGFTFDMGPSWYWMPDVFERFFDQFDKTPNDYYSLERIDPSYRIVYGKGDILDLPAGVDALCAVFERQERGSGASLIRFLGEGKVKYEVGMRNLVYQPGLSINELLTGDVIKNSLNLDVFNSLSSYVKKRFKSPRLVKLLEFPVLFLGASPEKTPALYSLMNYADMVLGTWYPRGGMYTVIEGLLALAKSLGVEFEYNSNVQQLIVKSAALTGCVVNNSFRPCDYVIASADYQHVEQQLLPSSYRTYSESYWKKRVLAPSCLIFFLGINKKLKNLLHHTLFFDEDFQKHSDEIYSSPQWPSSPQFYVSCTSKSDSTVAPPGNENIFVLIPVAPGLQDAEATREKYFDMILDRLENFTEENIRQHIVFKRSYAHNDFIADYNAFKGNAYGLANTLWQTANFKPSIVSKKVNNLFYTGHLTVPGPGVPPALISGEVVAKELIRRHRKKNIHDNAVI
jgi:phytoene desaturase